MLHLSRILSTERISSHVPSVSLSSSALEILITVNGPSDIRVASTFETVGMIQFNAGNLDSGRSFLEKAVEIYREHGNECESNLVSPLFVIGNIHKILQQTEEAEKVWVSAYETSTKSGAKSDVKLIIINLERILDTTTTTK